MNLLLRSELRKIATRPLTLVIAAVFLLGLFDVTWTAQGFGHLQWHNSLANYAFTQHAGQCGSRTGTDLARCRADVAANDMPLARHLLTYGRRIAAAAAPGQSPLGALGWAAGLFASLPGLFAAFLLAAASVAGEWEQRTATQLFLAERRLDRVLVAKAASIWVTLMGLLLLCGAITIGYDLAYSAHAYPLHDLMPSTSALVTYTVRRTAAAALLLAVSAGLGALAAARWRSRVNVLVLAVVLAITVFLGAPWPRLWAWTPSGVFASLAGFATETGVWDHAWPQGPSSGVPLLLRAVPAVALVVLLAAWLRSGHRSRGLV